MQFDPKNDNFLSFAQAAEAIPFRRAGRTIARTTLYRWATRGFRGVRLRTWRVGGARVTTQAALNHFIEQMSSAQPTQTRRA